MKGTNVVLPHQFLKHLIFGKKPQILGSQPITEEQIQPASLDCRLGDVVYCMKASGLPASGDTVESYIRLCSHYSFSMVNQGRTLLYPGQTYLIPLIERLELWKEYYAVFSPKSSIGRCDVFVRVVTDNQNVYDRTSRGYHGPLYLEITPLSFRVSVTPGLSLAQMRIKSNDELLTDSGIVNLHAEQGLLFSKDGLVMSTKELAVKRNRLYLHLDLDRDIVGYEALSVPAETLSLQALPGQYHAHDFWREVRRSHNSRIILKAGKFYLLSTKERVRIPKEYCAEMVAYDVASGEFRTHYAGFFDNGFGGSNGTTAVLEVRVQSTDVLFYGEPLICGMEFERTLEVPEKVYGEALGSHYTGSGPSLPKYFENTWS